MIEALFFNRDLSWIGFNARVLSEAGKPAVPLLERIRFLAIFSSNLDEFYRVRMPVLMALHARVDPGDGVPVPVLGEASKRIAVLQKQFGRVLNQEIIPQLARLGIDFYYGSPVPTRVSAALREVFFNEVLGLLQVSRIEPGARLPLVENNRLYQLVVAEDEQGNEVLFLVNIPAEDAGRFFRLADAGREQIFFLEDMVRHHLEDLLKGYRVLDSFNLKITRNAELSIGEEYGEELPAVLEARLQQRELGSATRLLYQPGLALRHLYAMISALGLETAMLVEGGRYHNLKDLADLPLPAQVPAYAPWSALKNVDIGSSGSLFDQISAKDLFLHTPYQDYRPVLRFFNEAATDPGVEEIWVTLYRVATQSKIARSLVTAARNGKQVIVLVELKARFDEANNIKWAKTMKAAGVTILYSRFDQKVHAKIALIKRVDSDGPGYLGLLATGNLNETTARFYTDHVLLTADQQLLAELRQLFLLLKTKDRLAPQPHFGHLLVAGFNLQQRFLDLISAEINEARAGRPALIMLKMNNLEEKVLISKLYEASCAGVEVRLIVRSICCLIPGVPGMSENIKVRRIVGRYLEHGRIFIFGNAARGQIFLGSADWMNRNIYNRIEVCFPLRDPLLQQEMREMMRLYLADDVQAVDLNSKLENEVPLRSNEPLDAQAAIYSFLAANKSTPRHESNP
ncbi:polyphosphate kinase 1 [Pedobacter yulinensis]|uniref:Polyphosphate kinase n=1 Tax=Pedobacter yulinensis TaxID=2126353 RepID=A0A2T3HKU6_9SPHI|nr:polyphosphate kinase 1 [Pedobacter yulinensis]PST83011.1 polyphosphate kinase 1 [Pedobacter yulinensis]